MSHTESRPTDAEEPSGRDRTTRVLPREGAVDPEARALRLAGTRLRPTLILRAPVDPTR